MAFHKARALQEAEKSVAQGKIAQAIKLYQDILDSDPSDLSLLNTVGDLYVRDRNISEGLKQFHKLAAAYVRDGFNVKAIAIYKKISKVDPNTVDTFLKLAELYQLQGLNREAREQYLQATEFLKKRNQPNRVIEVLRKLVQLDPENINLRNRLAAEYEQASQREDAAQVYLESAQFLLCRDEQEAAETVLKKAAELSPGNSTILMLSAGVAISRQNPEEAERIISSSPALQSDPAGKRILLDSYLGTGKVSEAAKLVLEIFQADPGEFAAVASVSALLVEKGDIEGAYQLLANVAEQLISRNQTPPLLAALRRIWTKAPTHIATLELIHQICERTADELTLPEVLEALGRAHEQAGELEKAEAAYLKLLVREPHNENYRGLLNAVQQKLGREPLPTGFSAADTARAEEEPTAEPAPVDANQQAMVNEALENSDLYARYNLTEQAISELERVLQVYPDQVDVHRRIIEISRKGYPARAATAAAQLARILAGRGDEETAAKYQAIASAKDTSAEIPLPPVNAAESAGPPPPALPEGGEAGMIPEFPISIIAPEEPATEEAATAPEEVPKDLTSAGLSEPPATPPPSTVREEPTTELDLTEDLQAITVFDFPAPAPSVPEADTPPPAGARLPADPTAATRPLAALSPDAPTTAQPEPLTARAEESTPEDLEDTRIEVDFYLDHGFWDEAREAVALLEDKYPRSSFVAQLRQHLDERLAQGPPAEPTVTVATTPRTGEPDTPPAAPDAAVEPPVVVNSGSVEVLGTLVENLAPAVDGSLASADAISKPPAEAAAAVTPPAASTNQGAAQLSSLLAEIEERGAAAAAAEDDPETHYNLGVAFREMGLLDEAIGEFQKLVRTASKGSFPPNFLQACSLLAVCFMEKKMPSVAVKWYVRALETPGLDEEAVMSLQYDLGLAYEQAGDPRNALERFTEVIGQNIDFRDVAEKVRDLQQKA